MARPADNFFMRNATLLAITTVTLVMVLSIFVFSRQNTMSAEARNWVNHTYEVKVHIQALIHTIEDATVGQRGFLVTGNEDYLESYYSALSSAGGTDASIDNSAPHSSIGDEMAALRKLTADNRVQQRNMDEMEEAIQNQLTYLGATIKLRQEKGLVGLQSMESLRGKLLMDRLRYVTRAMMAEENHLLALRTQADIASAEENNILVFSGIGVFYVLMVFSIWAYQRARKKAQAELLHYTRQLERSEEELKVQQEELKASNEEIEASNEELEEQNAQIRQQSEELARSKLLIEEKAKEVEVASKYKSEFLANMSHELRTPLNSLLILARSLANNEEGNLTDEQVEEARIIHNDGLELVNLINDILDLSKVESGKLNIIPEDATLDGIVKRLQQQFMPISKDKGVDFPVVMDGNVPVSLYTDTQRVEQILKNLLSNAFKFTQEGSVTLRVHCPDKQVGLQRASLVHGSSIAFSVTDTGIGIEPGKFKDIFEAFQQEDGSTDRHYGGTGLGLTIARKFAHLLGGEIHVESVKGQGSTFTLVLPVELVTAATTQQTQPVSLNTRTELKVMPRTLVPEFISDDRKNITDRDKVLLIIEDDKTFAGILMKIARKRGYKCLAAGDGKTGLLLAMEEPVTAIILDLKLPDIDGMHVLDQLKHDLRSRHIPVHIITGRDAGSDGLSLRKGAIGHLTKPVAAEGIEQAFGKIEALLAAEMKQILVVEDDKRNQTAIQSLLQKKDIKLTFSENGGVALEHLKATRFDCVILDLSLPGMSGFEWLERAERTMGEGRLPPVIVYTAKELTEEENRLLNRYTGSIIIKGAQSPERLLDEVTLFLHSVESTLSKDQLDIIRMQHDPDKALHGRTVLLTDDDLRNTFALSKLLKKHGMTVIIADNGQMALEKLKANKEIDLVIMDIMMPVMDGYHAMEAIRANDAYQDLPIIALTARAMPEEQEKCMAAGANDYMTKPVDVERLLSLLRVWLFKQEMAA